MKKYRVSIAGSRGFTGRECVRILSQHPAVEITSLLSSGHAGEKTSGIFPCYGELIPEFFSKEPDGQEDMIFLCLPHGKSCEFLKQYQLPESCKIIDLSTDHRPPRDSDYVYGLPEAYKESIATAQKIANPGCFATAIQLALLPLATTDDGTEAVHCSALTGATGAGVSLRESTSFCNRQNNLSVYKAFTHQHLDEINHTLSRAGASWKRDLVMIPFKAPVPRGIFASLCLPVSMSEGELLSLYKEYYREHPFVFLTENPPELKDVTGTNHCLLNLQVHQGYLHLVVAIDNLMKGAAGQAVQNMNIMLDLPEDLGLSFPPRLC